MTLVIGIVWGNGVLVSADSKASSGYIFHEERKIHPVYFVLNDKEYDLAVLAGAGDAAIVKQGFQIISDVFREWFNSIGSREDRNPTDDELKEIVAEVEYKLMNRYRDLRSLGIEPKSSLLLATVTQEGKPRLYVFDDRGIAEPKHDNPGYALLGSGLITGGLLLLRLLDYRPGENWDMGALSAFLIDMVSEVDLAVSPFLGESIYIRYENGRVVQGPLREEAFKKYKERIRKRREAFRLLWRVIEEIGEDNTLKGLESLIKKKKKSSR